MNDTAGTTPPVAGLPGSASEPDLSLDEIVRIVSRRRGVLVGIMAAALVLAFIATRMVTPLYSAEALVLIDPQDNRIVSLDSVVGGLSNDQETVQSEAYVLASRSLAERVIRRLELDRDPEFMPEPEPGRSTDPAVGMSAVVDRFLDRLDVRARESSRVISVSVRAEQPQRAAEIANTLTDEYLLTRLEAKFESTRRAAGWLNERIADLRDDVARAEAAVETLRQRHGLIASDRGSLPAQALGDINTQLIMARAARAEADARLARVRTLAQSATGAATASEVLDSPLIQRLREQEAEVQRRVAELSSEYGEQHPRMVQLRAEAADLKDKIDGEVRKIIARLQNEASVARARENALQASLSGIRDNVAQGNEREIELRAAEREAEAGRSLLSTLLARQKETLAREDLQSQQADARIIAAAGPPVEPAFPNTPVILGLVFLASLILGLLVILVLELLDSGFRSGEQVEQATGVPSLGFIPQAAGLSPGQSVLDYITGRPKSAFGEAVRTLNWSISLAYPDRPPKTLLITSARPDEGKTSVAACLAWVQGRAGQRVLLIDADTRRPRVHDLTGAPREPGLLDVLSGRVQLDDVIHNPGGSDLHVITAGAPTPNVPGLLGSSRMDELLREVQTRFDLVVIDSPPVMAASDARIIARKADATVVVVRWAATRREAVKLAIHQLDTAGGRVAGVVLSRVDARKHAQYSYGDSGAYAGDLEKYYAG